MYYLLLYDLVPDYLEKRAKYREEHLLLARKAHERGEMVMGGALAEPADGAVLVFRGQSAEIAENFAKNDPYVKAGLISRWRVRPWTVVIGG